MVGSEDSIGEPNIVLNTIVAEAFCEACDELEQAEDFEQAVHDMIKKLAKDHQRIVFNGNGYSSEWVEEAERRGLPNITNMLDAIPALTMESTVKMYEKFGVFTETELKSRAEIEYEIYAKKLNIEAKTMRDIIRKQVIPAVIGYTTTLATSITAVKAAGVGADVSTQSEMLKEVSARLAETKDALVALEKVNDEANACESQVERALYFRDHVVPAMANLRRPVDELEMLVDKSAWPMPSYGDMIFEV
jgi:glutamine synthetase